MLLQIFKKNVVNDGVNIEKHKFCYQTISIFINILFVQYLIIPNFIFGMPTLNTKKINK